MGSSKEVLNKVPNDRRHSEYSRKLKEISFVERLSLIEKCCSFRDDSPKTFDCLYEELDQTSAAPSGNPTYSVTNLRES